jgi:hypothetical protein
MMTPLSLNVLPGKFAVCRLDASAELPAWAAAGDWFSVTRTPSELSIVCRQERVPEGITAEKNWRCLQIAGPLDFALIGILHRLLEPLAKEKISVFTISTYDTDAILVKVERFQNAVRVLRTAGFIVINSD